MFLVLSPLAYVAWPGVSVAHLAKSQVDLVVPRALGLYWAYGEEFQCISVGLELLFGWFKSLFLKSIHTEGWPCMRSRRI